MSNLKRSPEVTIDLTLDDDEDCCPPSPKKSRCTTEIIKYDVPPPYLGSVLSKMAITSFGAFFRVAHSEVRGLDKRNTKSIVVAAISKLDINKHLTSLFSSTNLKNGKRIKIHYFKFEKFTNYYLVLDNASLTEYCPYLPYPSGYSHIFPTIYGLSFHIKNRDIVKHPIENETNFYENLIASMTPLENKRQMELEEIQFNEDLTDKIGIESFKYEKFTNFHFTFKNVSPRILSSIDGASTSNTLSVSTSTSTVTASTSTSTVTASSTSTNTVTASTSTNSLENVHTNRQIGVQVNVSMNSRGIQASTLQISRGTQVKALQSEKSCQTDPLPEDQDRIMCGICLSEYGKIIDIMATPCGHLFCKSCILQTLQQCGNKCPVCMQRINRNRCIRLFP